jgi:hypothetical protein
MFYDRADDDSRSWLRNTRFVDDLSDSVLACLASTRVKVSRGHNAPSQESRGWVRNTTDEPW